MADLASVLAVLAEGAGVPGADAVVSSSTAAMLCAALPHAVAPIAIREAPHAFQTEIIEQTRAALAGLRAVAEAAISGAGEAIEVARGRVDEATADETRAAEAARSAAEHAGHKAAERAALEAKLVPVAELPEVARILAQGAALGAERTRVRDLAAAIATAQGTDLSGMVIDFLQERGAEKALVAAVPVSFGLPAEARSSVDDLVMEEVKKLVGEILADLEGRIAATAEDVANAEAERLGAWAIMDVAKDEVTRAQGEEAAAAAVCARAQEEQAAAQRAVQECRSALSAALSMETLQQERLQRFEHTQAALERLTAPPAAVEGDASMAPAVTPKQAAEDVVMADLARVLPVAGA